jgi:long-chain acyl-CoA synthetase
MGSSRSDFMSGPFDVMLRWWKNGHENNGWHPLPLSAGSSPASLAPPDTQPWLRQLDAAGIARTLNYPSTTLGRMLDQSADRFGNLTAIIYGNTHWTYRQLQGTANRLAGGLSKLGVGREDRIILALPNCPEFVAAFFAIQKLGAIPVNVGPLMGADDLPAVIELTQPRVLLGLDLQASMLAQAGRHSRIEHWVWVTLQGYQNVLRRLGYQLKLWQGREMAGRTGSSVSLAHLMDTAPAKPPTALPDEGATALLQPTSGTTGAVKLARLSHRNLLANAMQVSACVGIGAGQERNLCVLPMFHVYGLLTGLINPVFNAGAMILETRFDVSECIELLLRHRPTIFPLVPTIADAICDALAEPPFRGEQGKLEGLRWCISGAAPLPRATAERFEHMTGAKIVEGYGLTEASPVTHCNLPSIPRVGSIGVPIPDTNCRIADLDDESRDAATGEPGELLVSGPQVMLGYYNDDAETGRALFTDSTGTLWLRTGDIATVDGDGFFHIVDRRKDMINRSGLKVYPAKTERVLCTHPNVDDVAVVGRPDAVHTEQVVAVVVLKSPLLDEAAMVRELRALCRQHLAPYEVPSQIEFIDRIPRSALGKVLKKQLRNSRISNPIPVPQKESA